MQKRRLAAIMFTDIVGYTSLMEADESLAIELLDRNLEVHKKVIKKYDGEILKELGDGILICFTSVVNAVHCAIELQDILINETDLKLRIGIHQGDIIFKDHDVFGDGVNVTFRIESKAEPGKIYISQQVFENIKNINDVNAKFIGKKKLRHIRKPIDIYELIKSKPSKGGNNSIIESKTDDFEFESNNKRSIKNRNKNKVYDQFKFKKSIFVSLIFLLLISLVSFKIIDRYYKVKWVRSEAIIRVQTLLEDALLADDNRIMNWDNDKAKMAYDLILKAHKYLPKDSAVNKLLKKCTQTVSINSEPKGAQVFYKNYFDSTYNWNLIGKTSLDSIVLPYGYFKWKFTKEGYQDVIAVASTIENPIFRTLDNIELIPFGMVRIKGGFIRDLELTNSYVDKNDLKIDDFYMDKYEVSNEQFKRFVDDKGYNKQDYWDAVYMVNSHKIKWEDVNKLFTDNTGRQGPSNWVAGNFPEGEGDLPVSGVSWHEANAYAKWSGKSLPTIYHWKLAQGLNLAYNKFYLPSFVLQTSNFNKKGKVRNKLDKGINTFGTMNLAGNVREWCFNISGDEKTLLGGALRIT